MVEFTFAASPRFDLFEFVEKLIMITSPQFVY